MKILYSQLYIYTQMMYNIPTSGVRMAAPFIFERRLSERKVRTPPAIAGKWVVGNANRRSSNAADRESATETIQQRLCYTQRLR